MNQKIIALIIFTVCFILSLGSGFLGTYYSIKNLEKLRLIEKSSNSEIAVIINVIKASSSANDTVYFKIGENIHRVHLDKVLNNLKMNDIVEVKTDVERKLWVIVGYEKALFARYTLQIIIFIVCFILSAFFLSGLVYIMRRM
jgi:hypothetical protein